MTSDTKTPSARRKMEEAQFFHWKVVGAGESASTESPEAYQYYFNAFLCAAHSVIDIAQYELRRGNVIGAWRKALSEEDRVFLQSMKDGRKSEVHRTGTKVIKQAGLPGNFKFPPGMRLVPERFFAVGSRNYGVVTACRRYLGLLADLLEYIDAQSSPASRRRS